MALRVQVLAEEKVVKAVVYRRLCCYAADDPGGKAMALLMALSIVSTLSIAVIPASFSLLAGTMPILRVRRN